MPDRRPMTLLRVEGLTAGYGGRPALEEVTFALEAGERIGILGPNGGGKTTLFRVLLGFVPQTERSRLEYPVSALDVALMGALSISPWWRPFGRAERTSALAALDRVGLSALADEQFGELSGGQRQRVLVARALVQDAPVLLLDEPFGGVDRRSEELLTELLGALAGDGRGLLVSTHDVEQARAWDRVLCLNRRAIAFGPPGEVLTVPVLEETYGGAIVTLPGLGVGILPPHHHEHE